MTLRHRNSKWMQNNFSRGLVLVKILWVFRSAFLHYQFSRSSLLYIEVWKRRCEIASTQRVVAEAWSFTFDLLPDLVVVLWRTNLKSIPYPKEHLCRRNRILELFSCLEVQTQNRVVENVVVQFVQSTMSTLSSKLQAHAFKHLWNDRCKIPLILCLCFRIQ